MITSRVVENIEYVGSHFHEMALLVSNLRDDVIMARQNRPIARLPLTPLQRKPRCMCTQFLNRLGQTLQAVTYLGLIHCRNEEIEL